MSDDVRSFGSLDQVSAFKFKNHLRKMRIVRSGNLPLKQLHNRISEGIFTSEVKCFASGNSKFFSYKNFFLSFVKVKDSFIKFCSTKYGQILDHTGSTLTVQEMIVADVFSYPRKSSLFGICKILKRGRTIIVDISSMVCKCVYLPIGESGEGTITEMLRTEC